MKEVSSVTNEKKPGVDVMKFFDKKTYNHLITEENLKDLQIGDVDEFNDDDAFSPSNRSARTKNNLEKAISLRQQKQKVTDFCLKLQELKERIDVYHQLFLNRQPKFIISKSTSKLHEQRKIVSKTASHIFTKRVPKEKADGGSLSGKNKDIWKRLSTQRKLVQSASQDQEQFGQKLNETKSTFSRNNTSNLSTLPGSKSTEKDQKRKFKDTMMQQEILEDCEHELREDSDFEETFTMKINQDIRAQIDEVRKMSDQIQTLSIVEAPLDQEFTQTLSKSICQSRFLKRHYNSKSTALLGITQQQKIAISSPKQQNLHQRRVITNSEKKFIKISVPSSSQTELEKNSTPIYNKEIIAESQQPVIKQSKKGMDDNSYTHQSSASQKNLFKAYNGFAHNFRAKQGFFNSRCQRSDLLDSTNNARSESQLPVIKSSTEIVKDLDQPLVKQEKPKSSRSTISPSKFDQKLKEISETYNNVKLVKYVGFSTSRTKHCKSPFQKNAFKSETKIRVRDNYTSPNKMDSQCVKQSMAIPFIQYTLEEGFQLNPDAAEFLSQLKGKIGVIAVCGKYRTGKSYILNKLFMEQLAEERRRRGFQVGPTINPCTKGLWIWKELFYAQNDEDKEMPIIIIDTEGLGAFDEDDNHDTKIFLLALLLCSLLIYNSVGNIDENVLNNLSLVVNLSKSLQIKNDSKAEDADELAEYFPSFLWILRDFALKLIDQEGNQLTQKQYLESALKEQKGTSDAIENKNRIRRLIKHFFKDRDCQTLIRPVEDEKQLQNLNQLQNEDLRPEFVEQIQQLRQKVFKKVKPKVLRNQIINGPMLLELAESYIKSLNGGKIPTIENAWNYMQASELERALKEVFSEYDQKVNIQIEKNLPMNEDQLNQIASKLKTESFLSFKSKILGDINNQKGQEYIDKMKKQFKQKYETLKKKNTQVTKDSCNAMLEQCFQQSIKPKLMNGLYKGYPDLKFDLEKLRNEFINLNPQGVSVKEYLFEYLFSKSLQVTEDLVSSQETTITNQMRVMHEQLKSAEKDLLRYKQELTHEKETCFMKLQEGESDRIKYKTDNAILTEKLTTAKIEIEELRMKLNCEYTEKVQELELQSKIQKDEIRKRDTEIKEMTNESVKISNEYQKKLALLEQERDFIKNDLHSVKETMQRKELDARDTCKQLRDREEKLKSYKQKRRQIEKENAEVKTTNQKLEQQLQQQPQSPKNGQVDSQQMEVMRKELENIRLEKLYLQNQLLNTQSQKDENKKLYETLLTMINNNQQMNGSSSQNKENVKGPKEIATTMEMIEKVSQLQSKMLDLEQSNQVLRNFKNLYKAAQEIKCSGCNKSFQPVLFKGHYLKCNKLVMETQDLGERMFIKFIDSEMNGQVLRFFVNHSGVQWYVKRSVSEISETLKVLQNTYHTADFFKSNLYKRFQKIEQSTTAADTNLNDLLDSVMAELASLYVVRKDKDFKQLFEVDSHLNDENLQTNQVLQIKSGNTQKETKYISFMKVTRSPINTSSSKQMYSFSKGQRFPTKAKPSCAQFCYELQGSVTKRAAGMGYGKRSSNLDRKSVSPSPHQYNISSDFTDQPKSRAVSFGISREYFQKVYLKENPPHDMSMPGPSQYNIKTEFTQRSGSKYSMRPKTATSSSFQDFTKGYPGPGAYNHRVEELNNISCIVPKYIKHGTTIISGSGKRFNNDYVKRSREIPGPGTYKAPGLDSKGNYQYAKFKSSGAPVFSKEQRKVNLDTSATRKSKFDLFLILLLVTPGPGTYRVHSDFGFINENHPSISARSRLSSRKNSYIRHSHRN